MFFFKLNTSNFEESLVLKYASALENLSELEGLGYTIVHEVDVPTMTQHPYVSQEQ